MTSNTADWLLEISGLTVGCRDGETNDVVAQGSALAGQVRAAAASWTATSGCTPTACADGCPLDAIDGGVAACRLAFALAPAEGAPLTRLPRERAAARYLQALEAASTAVFHCRRHAHPVGECWFGGRFADGATERCGDVLAVAHRISR